jgi:hypothetical protein
MDVYEAGCKGVDWIHLDLDRNKREHCNEISGSIKCGEIFDHSKNYFILKKESAPWS